MKYITNAKGKKTSVVVPLKDWETLNDNYTKLLNKLQVLTGIKNGVKEVRSARKTGNKMQTLKSFLNEGN